MVSLLDNGSGFRKVAPNTRSSEKPWITGPDHVSGCMADAASWRAEELAVVLFTAGAADVWAGASVCHPSSRPSGPGAGPVRESHRSSLRRSRYLRMRPRGASPRARVDGRQMKAVTVCARTAGARGTLPRVRAVGFTQARRRLHSVVTRVRSGRDHAVSRTLGVTAGQRCVRAPTATRDTSCMYEPSPTCSGWMSSAAQKLWSPVSSDARRSPMLGAASRGSCGPRGC